MCCLVFINTHYIIPVHKLICVFVEAEPPHGYIKLTLKVALLGTRLISIYFITYLMHTIWAVHKTTSALFVRSVCDIMEGAVDRRDGCKLPDKTEFLNMHLLYFCFGKLSWTSIWAGNFWNCRSASICLATMNVPLRGWNI